MQHVVDHFSIVIQPPPPLPVKENSASKNSLSLPEDVGSPPDIPKRPDIKIPDDTTDS